MAEQESLFNIKEKKESLKANKQNGHKVVIIDGHALIFRSYYAIRELKNSRGQSTNAVFGFIRALLKILQEEAEHDSTIVTFDAPAKTFRHDQFPEYKAGRAATPEDLPQQIAIIKELVKYMGLYQIEYIGLEADDLIGTIATKVNKMGYAVEIVTSDRDAYQLINKDTCVRGLVKTDRYGPDEVFKKYGVTVEQWIDYRALTGDSSDNIPGAKGIGPKSAQKLLKRYGSLDYILENLDSIEPVGFAKKIEASLEDVKFSKMLSKIVTDADIEIEPKKWAIRDMNANKMLEILNELEFGSIIRELNLTDNKAKNYIEKPWTEITKEGSLGFLLSQASPMNSDLLELSLVNKESLATANSKEEKLEIPQNINAIDAKALNVWALKNGLNSQAADDPLLMANVIDSNNTSAEAICQRYAASEWDKSSKARAIATAELLKALPEKMETKQKELYEKLEKPLQNVLAEMEFKGIRIDSLELQEQSKSLAKKLEKIENRVREIADNPLLNLNSRDQLAELLFDKLELSAGKKTSTGKRSTAVAVLEGLKDEHEVVALILEYREFAKLKSTYLDPLPKLVNPITNRLHTTFRQHVVSTGRLSSINPNLQNIPVRTDIGRQIRKAFIAADGCILIAADYSQIELRVLAHIADEQALIDAFNSNEDIHARTAAQVYGVGLEAVQPDMRRIAKIINFGVLYGMGAHRLARELGIEFAAADSFIKGYFAGYPNVRKYIDDTLEFTRKYGYVETILGRRRYFGGVNAKNRNAREFAERAAYNMPIQGSAADIIKLAMIKLAPKLKELGAAMLLQVHDELIVETPKDKIEQTKQLIKETMENAYELKVPLIADLGLGDNWLEAK